MDLPPKTLIIKCIKIVLPLYFVSAGIGNIITCIMYNNFNLVYSGVSIITLGIILTILFRNEMAETLEIIYMKEQKHVINGE
jgi:hypothetical protein